MNERIDFNSYVEIKNQINKECEKLLDESVRLKIKENNLPDFIKYQYEYLYEVMIKNGQIYGAFYQIKDLFEMNIKLPVIIFLYGMTKFIIDNNINANDFGINARYHEKIKDDFYGIILGKLPALGDWEVLCQILSKFGEKDIERIPVEQEHYDFYLCMLKIIKAFTKKYFSFKDRGSKTPITISAYRNDKLGHGATNLDYKDFFEDFKHFLNALNEVLVLADYNDNIKFDVNGEELIVTYKGIEFHLEHYINICDKFGTMLSVSMVESFHDRKQTALLLNYNNGYKLPDLNLYKDLSILKNERFNFVQTSAKSLDSDDVDIEDYMTLFKKKRIIVENEIFGETIKQFIPIISNPKNYKKGILRIMADGGIGKTTFVRTLTDSATEKISIENSYEMLLKDNGYLTWGYFADGYNSSSSTFFRDRFVSFIESNLNKAGFCKEYTKAKSDLYNINNQISHLDKKWSNYFKWALVLLKKRFSNPELKLLILIDGLDEINTNYFDAIKFDSIFNVKYLPEDLFVVGLERYESQIEVNTNNLGFKKKQAIQSLATYETKVIRKSDETYYRTLIEYVKVLLSRTKIKLILKELDSEFVNEGEIREEFYKYIVEMSDCQFNKLTVLTRALEVDPYNFLQFLNINCNRNVDKGVIECYLRSLQHTGEKYVKNLARALVALNRTSGALKLEELNYLLFNDSSDVIDYKLNAFKNDIIDFLECSNNINGKLYSIKDSFWKKELNSGIFYELTHEFEIEMKYRVDAILKEVINDFANKKSIVNNYGILLFNEFLDENVLKNKAVVEAILNYVTQLKYQNESGDKFYQNRILILLDKIEKYITQSDINEYSLFLLNKAIVYMKLGAFSKSFGYFEELNAFIKNNINNIKIGILIEFAKSAKTILLINNGDERVIGVIYNKVIKLLQLCETKGVNIPSAIRAELYIENSNIEQRLNRLGRAEKSLENARNLIEDYDNNLYVDMLISYVNYYALLLFNKLEHDEYEKAYENYSQCIKQVKDILLNKKVDDCSISDVKRILAILEYEFIKAVGTNKKVFDLDEIVVMLNKAYEIYQHIFDRKHLVKTAMDDLLLGLIYFLYAYYHYYKSDKSDNNDSLMYLEKFGDIIKNLYRNNYNNKIQDFYNMYLDFLQMLQDDGIDNVSSILIDTNLSEKEIRIFSETVGLESRIESLNNETAKKGYLQQIIAKLESVLKINLKEIIKLDNLNFAYKIGSSLFTNLESSKKLTKINVLHKLADTYYKYSKTYSDVRKLKSELNKNDLIWGATIIYESLLNNCSKMYLEEYGTGIKSSLCSCYIDLMEYYAELDKIKSLVMVDKAIEILEEIYDSESDKSNSEDELTKILAQRPDLRGTLVYLQNAPETEVGERLAECLMKKNKLLWDMDGRENLQLITINEVIHRYTELRNTYLEKARRFYTHYDFLIEKATMNLLEAYCEKFSVILLSGYLNPKIIFTPANNDKRYDDELEMLLEEIDIAETIAFEGKLYTQQGIVMVYRLTVLISLKRTEDIKRYMDRFKDFQKEYVVDIDQEGTRSVVSKFVNFIQSILLTDQEIERLFLDSYFANDLKRIQSLRSDFDGIYKKYVSICGDVSKIGNPKWYNGLRYLKFKVLNNKLSYLKEEKEAIRKDIIIKEKFLSEKLCKYEDEIEELKILMNCLRIIAEELANKYRITIALNDDFS